MLKFDVWTEKTNADRSGTEAITVATWLDVSEVFAIRADADPTWTILTFRPTAGPRTLIVKGTADAVAALIQTERRSERRPS